MTLKKKRTKKVSKKKSGPVSQKSKAQPGYPRLVGVLHLPPLPGAPGAMGESPFEIISQAVQQAVAEAQTLEKLGFDALIVENFGDAPFYRDQVPPETVAALALIAAAVRESVSIPVGVNVLRNDGRAALAIAATAGLEFLRINILSGVAATDQGWISGDGAFLLRERARLGAPAAIFADVAVKHAINYSARSLTLAIEEVVGRGGADAVIVTGATTGREVEREVLKEASQTCRELGVPLYVGSGATPENVAFLLEHATGVIVGSSLREKGKAGAPLSLKRARAFVKALPRA